MRIALAITVLAVTVLVTGLTLSPPAIAAALPTPEQEVAVTRQCLTWFADTTYEAPTQTQNLDDGLCFNGEIRAGDDTAFLAALKSHPGGQPLVIVVRSGGGDVATALTMAEAILERPVTVIAVQLCASACANFLIPAGRRKIVLADTLLMYHGATTLDFLDGLAESTRNQIETLAKGNPAMTEESDALVYKTIDGVRQSLNGLVARQDAFLVKAGISPTLFRWMNLYNHMTRAEKSAHCPAEPHMIVYPVAVLARFNLTLDIYDGPRSQEAVDRLASKMKLENPLCYWQE